MANKTNIPVDEKEVAVQLMRYKLAGRDIEGTLDGELTYFKARPSEFLKLPKGFTTIPRGALVDIYNATGIYVPASYKIAHKCAIDSGVDLFDNACCQHSEFTLILGTDSIDFIAPFFDSVQANLVDLYVDSVIEHFTIIAEADKVAVAKGCLSAFKTINSDESTSWVVPKLYCRKVFNKGVFDFLCTLSDAEQVEVVKYLRETLDIEGIVSALEFSPHGDDYRQEDEEFLILSELYCDFRTVKLDIFRNLTIFCLDMGESEIAKLSESMQEFLHDMKLVYNAIELGISKVIDVYVRFSINVDDVNDLVLSMDEVSALDMNFGTMYFEKICKGKVFDDLDNMYIEPFANIVLDFLKPIIDKR